MSELEPSIETHNITEYDFAPLYSTDDSIVIEDYMLRKQIEEIYSIKNHITQLHKEAIANYGWWDHVGEGFLKALNGLKSFCSGAVQEIIVDPFKKLVTGLIVLFIVLCFVLWMYRRRSKKIKH